MNTWSKIIIGIAGVVLLSVGGYFATQTISHPNDSNKDQTEIANSNEVGDQHEFKSNQTNSTAQQSSTSETTSIPWARTQDGWMAQGQVPKCSEPITMPAPVNLELATAMLYPGQYRGGQYKPHGGFIFKNSKNEDITVTIPYEAYLTKASHYIEQGETQTFLVFTAPCGVMYRFDHLLTLSPKYQAIMDKLPAPKVDDSTTTDINPPIKATLGEPVATAVGFKKTNNTSVDFGVYDIRSKNAISSDATWASKHADDSEFAPYALCILDILSTADAAKAKALPGGDAQAGKQSDYCK